MPFFVPEDIIHLVLDHISTQRDLARCCSTSKTFLLIARPLLYHSVEVNFYQKTKQGGPWDRWYIRKVSNSLLSTIRDFQHLAQLVRQVSFVRDSAWSPSLPAQPDTVLQELLVVLPLVESFFLRDFPNVRRLDSVIGRHQRRMYQVHEGAGESRSGTGLAFSLSAKPSNFRVEQLSGVYTGFGYTPPYSNWTWDYRDFRRLLRLSTNTLRYLSIPLEHLTDITTFPSVERLSIRLRPAAVKVDKLILTLSYFPSLLSLHLEGSITREPLIKLLVEKEFVESLPPPLSHLSLDYQLPSKYLSSFLDRLPESTSLKRFDCLREWGPKWRVATAEEDSESLEMSDERKSQVIERYRERGIKLSYDVVYRTW